MLAASPKTSVGMRPQREMLLSYAPVQLVDVDPTYLETAGVDRDLFVDTAGEAVEFRSKTSDLIGYGLLRQFPEPITHVTEATFVLGEEATSYVPDLYYVVRDAILVESKKRGVRRIQCHVFEDKPRDRHFAERLGFVAEGLLARYGPQERGVYIMRMENFYD